jgi:hypothetical protein
MLPTRPELELEAIQIASNFLIGSAVRNARVLTRAETPVSHADSGAAWRSDDAYGFVRILPCQEGGEGYQRRRVDHSPRRQGLQRQVCIGACQRTGQQRRHVPEFFYKGYPRRSVFRRATSLVIIGVGANSATQESQSL